MPQTFVFIGGLQRSGTTLLGRLLAEHPDITGLAGTPTREDEGQFVQDVYLDDHAMGRRWHTPKGPMYQGVVHRWAHHPRAHLTEADARPDTAARLRAAWDPYWQDPHAPYLVEKSPSNVMRTRFLQEAFPGSRFVVITRHPIVQGLAARKWADRVHRVGFRFDDFLEHWLTAMEAFAADRERLEGASMIRYEDLTADPAHTLRAVQDAIGATPADIDVASVRDANDDYRAYWRAYRGGSGRLFHLEKRRKRLRGRIDQSLEVAHGLLRGPRVQARLVKKFEDRVRPFGYTLTRLQ